MGESCERPLVTGYKPEAQREGQQRAANGLLAFTGLKLPEFAPK